MIAMITTHNSNYYPLKILATLSLFQLCAWSHPSGLLMAPNYETMKVYGTPLPVWLKSLDTSKSGPECCNNSL